MIYIVLLNKLMNQLTLLIKIKTQKDYFLPNNVYKLFYLIIYIPLIA